MASLPWLVTAEPEGGRPRRTHPLTPLLDVFASGRELVPALVAMIALGWLWLLPVGLVALVAYRALAWWRRTYHFDGTVLHVDEGILARTQRRVPADRIQQVDLIRKLRHQISGLTVLRVETAGGSGGSEVELDAVDQRTAIALRHALLAARDGTAPAGPDRADTGPTGALSAAPPPEAPGEPVLSLGIGRLALAGVTGGQLLVLGTALAWSTQVVDDLPGRLLDRLEPGDVTLSGPLAVAAVVVVGVAVWLGVAALSAILSWYGLTVTRVGDELHLARGLLERRDGVIPLERLQVVRVSQSLLRRPLGRWSVLVQSAGRPGGNEGQASRSVIPLVTGAELDRLLGQMLPGVQVPLLVGAPAAARPRAIGRRVAVAALAAAPLLFFAGVAGVTGWTAVVALSVVWGFDAYRGLGHAWVGPVLVARTGSLVRETTFTPTAKAQSARVTASPLQRRRSLATLRVDVAGRGSAPRVVDEQREMAVELLERALGPARPLTRPR